LQIDVRENRRGNQEWTIQRNGQNCVHKTQDENKQIKNTICGGRHYTQTNTNNINKKWALLQTTRGKDEPNIVFMQIS